MLGGSAQNLFWRLCAGLVLVFLAIGSTAAVVDSKDRVVAIGDIHGDFDDFCLILRRAHLVDQQNHWIGGNATLVQTGDVIDRGPKGPQAMDLLMALEPEATKTGGKVLPLLGNHEVMNLLGDLRYVTPPTYAAFADNDSEKRRKAGYQQYAAWAASHAKWLAALKEPILPRSEQDWMAQHPDGFLEYRQAFSTDGKYGKWLRQHAAVAKVGGIVFLHGGIAPALIQTSIEQMNSQVAQEIEYFDKAIQELVSKKVILPFFAIREIATAVQLQLLEERSAGTAADAEYDKRLQRLLDLNNWLCMRNDGPLWFRGYDAWTDEAGNEQIPKILAAYDATHIVVAHTVQKTANIRSRFDGKVFLIDTGMLSTYYPGGRASALDIEDGKITAEYVDGQEVLSDTKNPASPGKPN